MNTETVGPIPVPPTIDFEDFELTKSEMFAEVK
jgi:hypothetical protein